MSSLCGTNCCEECGRKQDCGGCEKCGGQPFGGSCIAAECVRRGGLDEFFHFKKELISECNALQIKGLRVKNLNLLNGFFVNLGYPLANGQKVKFLKDNRVYLGNQIEIEGSERCYGIVADKGFILVCEYGCNGADPEIVLYKKR